MASSTSISKNPCSKCGSTRWVAPCEGCHALFCSRHANDHQIELTAQLENIQQQSNHLEQIYNQHEKRQEHPLFSQIDVWEHDTIVKIQQAAQIARNELRQSLEESNNRMKTIFNEFSAELHAGHENEHFTEIELEKWKETLMNIRKQLETPCDIQLVEDNNLPPIHLIKINATKQTTMVTIPSFSQPVQLQVDTNDTECTYDDNLNKPPLTTIIDNNDTPTREALTTNESSTMPKVEFPTAIDSCDLASPEPAVFLDPTKTTHLVLLQPLSTTTTTTQSQLPEILGELAGRDLQIFNRKEDCLSELECYEQATIFIDISGVISQEESHLLDNISNLQNVYCIYIRGMPPENSEECNQFFRRYSRIKGIFDNEQRLMVQWITDTANEYKKTGDSYVERGDKDKGRICFEQGIALYKRLSEFLNKKRNVR